MIKSVQKMETIVVGAETTTTVDQVKDLVEKEKNATVFCIYQIERYGLASGAMGGHRAVYQATSGPYGSGMLESDRIYYAVSYFVDDMKAFEDTLKKFQKEIDMKRKKDHEDYLKAEAARKQAEIFELAEKLAKMKADYGEIKKSIS